MRIEFIVICLLFTSSVFALEASSPNAGDGRAINLELSVEDFLSLTDTPSTYSGQTGLCALVNAGENGIEFGACAGGVGGDITAVNTAGPYLTGGAASGDVSLLLDESVLNATIDARSLNQSEADLLYDLLGAGNSSWNQSYANTLYDLLGSGNSSWNQSYAGGLYQPLEDQRVSTTDNVVFNRINASYANITNFLTQSMEWSATDDGSNLALNFMGVGGNNYVSLETTGGFFQLYANPNAGNDYLLATITETQGAATELNFYEGGTGHNRFWDSGSMRLGGSASRLCSALTTDVDCDTAATGADLVVQDDIWLGGKIFANDWSNVTGHTVDTNYSSGGIINGNITMNNDTKTFYGSENQAEIYWNGTVLVIKVS